MKLNWLEKLIMNSPIRSMNQRKEARVMLQLGGNVGGGKVLEVGCGRGVGVEIILDMFGASHVEAFDFDPDQVRLAKQRLSSKYGDKVNLYVGDATKIPFPDDHFDAVFESGVLHHIPDSSAAISEIARVLKHGARFFFMEVLSSITMKPIVRVLMQHAPEAQFTWEELSLKLAKSGLVVSEDSFAASPTRVVGVAWKSAYAAE